MTNLGAPEAPAGGGTAPPHPSTRRQWIVTGAVTAVLALALWGAVTIGGGRTTAIQPGTAAPAFHAVTVGDAHGGGEPSTIADYRGRVVLLNLWATWCAPCREEMPRIERLHQELGAQGLAVIAVSVDNPGMADAIREFRRELGLTFQILYDESGRIRDDYQTSGVPETFFIDREGVIRRRLIGSAWTVEEQRPLLLELLAERGP